MVILYGKDRIHFVTYKNWPYEKYDWSLINSVTSVTSLHYTLNCLWSLSEQYCINVEF